MAGWAALILVVVLPLAHAAGPVGLALDTTCTNAECYKLCGNQPVRRVHPTILH